MTEKLVSVIEMTLLYAVQYSFVLLRPNIEVKLSYLWLVFAHP